MNRPISFLARVRRNHPKELRSERRRRYFQPRIEGLESRAVPALLLNEFSVNTPATDNPFEYMEVKDSPSATIPAGTYLVDFEGDGTGAGIADMVVNLSGMTVGTNGLLMVKSPTGGHTPPAATTVVTDAQLDTVGGGLENGTISFLLISSGTAITETTDYDTNNDGLFDALPGGAVILDAVGWSDGGGSDRVYGGVSLTQASGVTDAASRFSNNSATSSPTAWYNGDLTGIDNTAVDYDATTGSANLPTNAKITPGDANFASNQQSTTTSVVADINPTVFGEMVTFTATVTTGTGTPTGTVEFFDGATSLGTDTLDGSAQATLGVGNLPVGSRSITATYVGDTNYSGSTSSPITQTVNQASTTTALGSSVNPSVFGQSVTFTATVTVVAPGGGTATGTVEFFDGATSLGTDSLDGSGLASIDVSTLTVGGHSITATYGGATAYVGSTSSPLSQTVNQASTTTALGSSANPSVFGQSVTFTATVTAVAPGSGTPTGTVEFFDGATSLGTDTLNGSGQASINVSSFTVGSHSITATYGGATAYVGSTSSPLSQTVNKSSTSTAVVSSVNPSVFGQSVTFTATVTVVAPGTGTPSGTVEFFDGATSLGTDTLDGGGQASIGVANLSVAGHNITATYNGSPPYFGSTSSVLTQTVNKASTNTAVVASTNPTVFGQTVTFTATVTSVAPGAGTPAGTVEFFFGATSLGTDTLDGSGVAQLPTGAIPVGTHSVTAQYLGDSSYNTSTSTGLSHTVNKANTTSVVISSGSPSLHNQQVTFTATVSAVAPGSGVPTGSVEFFDGVTSLGTQPLNGSGQALLNTTGLSIGSHSITVSYLGSSNYNTSTSAPITQVVNQLVATWVGGASGDPTSWSNGANWDGGLVPTDGDEAIFTGFGTQSFVSVIDPTHPGTIAAITIDGTWGGQITVNRSMSVTDRLDLGSGSIDGNGAVSFDGGTWNFGSVDVGTGGWTNNGTLVANGFFVQIIGSGTFVNNSVFSQPTGGTTISATFTNNGTVDVAGLLQLTGPFTNFSGTTLTGGTYKLTGTLQFNGADIQTNAATLELTGPGSSILDQSNNNGLANYAANTAAGSLTLATGRAITTVGPFANAGTLALKPGGRFTSTGVMTQTAGQTLLLGGGLKVPSGMQLNGGLLSGKGSVLGNVTNNGGTVVPGGTGAAGVLRINGHYVQGPGGTLNIEIGGLTQGVDYDLLRAQLTATLDGTMNVSFLGPMCPLTAMRFK